MAGADKTFGFPGEEPVADAPVRHRLVGGMSFQDDPTGRGYSVRCTCGWDSGLCPTSVLADAAGEQHLELERGDIPRRRPRLR